MAETNYPATLMSLKGWLDQNISEVVGKVKLYDEICTAIETGEGDPNELILNGDQIVKLETDKVEIEQWIIAACNFVGIEPVEVVEEE